MSCPPGTDSVTPSDEALLALAREESRVLITEDKDFGELVFLRGLPHPGIVRLVEMTPMQRADAMRMRCVAERSSSSPERACAYSRHIVSSSMMNRNPSAEC